MRSSIRQGEKNRVKNTLAYHAKSIFFDIEFNRLYHIFYSKVENLSCKLDRFRALLKKFSLVKRSPLS